MGALALYESGLTPDEPSLAPGEPRSAKSTRITHPAMLIWLTRHGPLTNVKDRRCKSTTILPLSKQLRARPTATPVRVRPHTSEGGQGPGEGGAGTECRR